MSNSINNTAKVLVSNESSTLIDNKTTTNEVISRAGWFAIIVAALGYFVDVFVMFLFANFRVASLTALGLSPEQVTTVGASLVNWQLSGLLVGGFIWGIIGDKKGRSSVMFGSIFLYSTATLLNAFVTTVEQYTILRFIAGIGLAGEIGAGITLVSELLPKSKRGLGTTIVATFGVSGAVAVGVVAKLVDWQMGYIVGGIMGLCLLALRVLVHESGIYEKTKHDTTVKKGSLLTIFGSFKLLLTYLSCIAIGTPIIVMSILLATFAPEIAAAIGIQEKVTVPTVLIFGGTGITIGDVLAGVLSQKMKSRKLPIFLLISSALIVATVLLSGLITTANGYNWAVGIYGLASGFWACLITTTAEQFGTNIRATATTTIPNLIRGCGILMTSSFIALKAYGFSAHTSISITIGTVFICALMGLYYIKETFHTDLDFND